jgi:hypothetical protein
MWLRGFAILACVSGCTGEPRNKPSPDDGKGRKEETTHLTASYPTSNHPAVHAVDEEIRPEEIEGILLPSGTCLVLATPAGRWFERIVVVVELALDHDRWSVQKYKMAEFSDRFFGDDFGVVIPWFDPILGEVKVEESAERSSDSIRCSLRLEYTMEDGSKYAVDGSFSVVPRSTVDEVPFELQRFLHDTNADLK